MLKVFNLSWLNNLRQRLSSPSSLIVGQVIDWRNNDIFYKTVVSNEAFSFLNEVDSYPVNVVIRNSAATPVTVTFPVGVVYGPNVSLSIESSHETVYTFIRFNGVIHAASSNNLINI